MRVGAVGFWFFLATSWASSASALPPSGDTISSPGNQARVRSINLVLSLAPPHQINVTSKVSVDDARRDVEAHPADADLWLQLGMSLETAGDLDGAVEAYSRATKLPPKVYGRAYLYRDLAILLEQRGDLEGALAAMRVGVRSWPLRGRLFCWGYEAEMMVRLLVRTNDWNGAVSFYGPLVRQHPDNPNSARCMKLYEAIEQE